MQKLLKALGDRRLALQDGEQQKGFTLIELLVVVIIIGILAAIAIPVFLNQREAAWRSAVESDLRNAALVVETYTTNNNGAITGFAGAADGEQLIQESDGVTVTFAPDASDNRQYTLTGSHTSLPGDQIIYSSISGGLGDWTVTP